MRRTSLVFALAIVSLGWSRPSKAENQTGFLFRTLDQAGITYPYTVYVPRTYDAGRKWPLIVFLHGAGECGNDGLKQVIQGIGSAVMWNPERWPYIVIFPQKPRVEDQWEKYDDVVMAMLRRTMIDYSVDPAELYLTGLSQGGHGAWTLGAAHADLWAAIAPICGYGDPGKLAYSLKAIPVRCFHGGADPVVPPKQSQDMVNAIKALGGTATLVTYPGVGHNSWDKAYREDKLWDWFVSHRRADR